jgi:hypothetical protein
MNFDNSKMSQEEIIIKILEYVCKNKDLNDVTPEMIQRDLFPDIKLDEILYLFTVIKQKNILQITALGKFKIYLQYRLGLEDYVKNLKKMTNREKLHKIVEFLSTQYTPAKQSFDSGEIAKALDPELSIYEINSLLEKLISDEVVNDVTTDQSYLKDMMEVLVISKTRNAFHNKKYLQEEDEDFSLPTYQNISAKNVIVGNISGPVTQGDNSTKITNKTKGKTTLLNNIYWIIGALVGLTVLITFVLKLLKII